MKVSLIACIQCHSELLFVYFNGFYLLDEKPKLEILCNKDKKIKNKKKNTNKEQNMTLFVNLSMGR